MSYRSYSIEQKIKFLDLLKENGSVIASARKAGVQRYSKDLDCQRKDVAS